MGTVDIHSHYVPSSWPDLGDGLPRLRVDSEREAMIMIGTKEFRRVEDNAWNPHVRLADMDADGVSVQVVSPTPVFFAYEETGDVALHVARIFNDIALEICAEGEGRLLPFCQVPLQDADKACAELDRAMANGHRGVEIGNHIGDRDLDDEGIVTFLQHCADRNVPVFVHPWGMKKTPRNDRWMAQWLSGMPEETHLSILALILGGVFDRVPDTLRLCFAHGGGSFPYWMGRFENAWHNRADLIATSEHPPSYYLNRFSVDSVVFRPEALRLLVDTLGADRVMVGSDYPYPLGERPVGAVVDKSDFLSDREREQILFRNASTFLGIQPPI
ncbi:amidohydrolase family protein [Klugiella xanthotipulae]|uniref:2-amino-3-carboxymuconate-6-semialdehyde decarboxylase n=1 Tax=Klugiella xanthotipulae TaxID=244735 RepID=A0A543HT10_9MICO|nr:amidohydrolase family protein [Klugiella xanthotipulae]TQM61496.1 aminocarboxymuconate-semialdehyde decarboxylase [Klugiella xanthotipulae]